MFRKIHPLHIRTAPVPEGIRHCRVGTVTFKQARPFTQTVRYPREHSDPCRNGVVIRKIKASTEVTTKRFRCTNETRSAGAQISASRSHVHFSLLVCTLHHTYYVSSTVARSYTRVHVRRRVKRTRRVIISFLADPLVVPACCTLVFCTLVPTRTIARDTRTQARNDDDQACIRVPAGA